VPIDLFPMMAESIYRLCEGGMAGRRSAIVAANALQKATFDFIRYDAHILPYEIGVFTSLEEAVAWVGASADSHSPSGDAPA